MRLAAAIAAVALAACTQQAQPAPEAAPIDLSIGPVGAAGITVSQRYADVGDVAIGYALTRGADRISLLRDGTRVFDVFPGADGNVGMVTTRDPRARGPVNEAIGAAFGDAPATDSLFCRSAEEGESFSFTCAAREDGTFWRAYALPETYRGPRAPFERIEPDAALAARLVMMTWIARQES